MKRLFTFFSILLCSCQSFIKMDSQQLDQNRRKDFGKCWQRQGSINFLVYMQSHPYQSAMLDWTHENKPRKHWKWEIYDPLGRTLFNGLIVDGKIKVQDSNQSFRLDKVHIKEDYIYYEKMNSFLKWKELHCLIGLEIPQDWLELRMFREKNTEQGWKHIRFKEKDRIIDAYFSENKICGNVRTPVAKIFTWDRFEWCIYKTERKGFLDFGYGTRLEWMNEEGGKAE